MRVVFFGTPDFAANVLLALIEAKVDIVAVVSKPDRPKDRSKTPVKTQVRVVAEAHRLPLYQPEKASDPAFYQVLEGLKADLFVVVAYGEIINQATLDLPRLACINLHASLLPHLRGAAPIQRSILLGDTVSGITIMHMVKKMDAGDIIKQVSVPIGPDETAGELSQKLCSIGKTALIEVIHSFEQGLQTRTPQDEQRVTYAPKIELDDCKIHFSKESKDVHNLVRAVNPEPVAFCMIKIGDETKRLRLFKTKNHPEMHLVEGQIQIERGKHIFVGCRKGAIELIEVQQEGKKRMAAADYFRGILGSPILI